MHNLLQPKDYQNMDKQFEKISNIGFALLQKTYSACTEFRKLFYTDGYKFVFPEDAMEKCSCKPRNSQNNK